MDGTLAPVMRHKAGQGDMTAADYRACRLGSPSPLLGDDRAALLEELENRPTCYPASLDADGIVEEMLAR